MNVTPLELAAALKSSQIPVGDVVRETPLTDAEIRINGNVHVQLGHDYMIIVEENPDGTFLFHSPTQSIRKLIAHLKKIVGVK